VAPADPYSGPNQSTVVGYCRACGKPLDASSVRAAHGAIYCQEHVPMDERASGSSPYSASAYTAPPPIPNPDVSPKLAFVLGLIPGVGAIYNSQYLKGLIHVLIAGVLFSLVDNPPGGFGALTALMLAGFFWYMAFEAYHTASKRRMGLKVDQFSSVMPLRQPGFPGTPVILIALGVIFLLNNLGILHLREVLRYWPVLLIALGVYMLYVRFAAKKEAGL
jgi:hypothetical protein